MSTWIHASGSSSTPLQRMNNQAQVSNVLGTATLRTVGEEAIVAISLSTQMQEVALDQVVSHQDSRRQPQHERADQHRPGRLLLAVVRPPLRLEIKNDDFQSVEAVIQHRRHQRDLAQHERRASVERNGVLVKLGSEGNGGGVEDVEGQEEER